MGGNSRQRKSNSTSSFSIFNIFKSKRRRSSSSSSDDYYHHHQEEVASARSRVWPSDEDRGRWVADPAINRKAEDFIAKIHRNIATDFEPKTYTISSTTTTTVN
ncbi:hypothetical protein CsatB_030384 [Cannabis sativa]